MRHPIPTDAARGAFNMHAEASRVLLCQSCDMTTIPALEGGLVAVSRLRKLAAAMETTLRRQIATARQAEREATREAERAERRNEAIRRERGLPSGSADLTIPNF